MTFDVAILSEIGPRAENEDCVGVWSLPRDRIGLAVADGLGGHFGGRFASNFAIEQFGRAIEADPQPDLEVIVRDIHAALREEQRRHPQWRDMGTTFSAVILSENLLLGVHAGDSRIAVSRALGIRRLTCDHTELQRLLEANKISPEQAATYPRKNILESAIGIKGKLRLDVIRFDLQRGDRIFLTSDGVHNKIFLKELFSLSSQCETPSKLIRAVKDEMQRRGAEDNFSMICCFVR